MFKQWQQFTFAALAVLCLFTLSALPAQADDNPSPQVSQHSTWGQMKVVYRGNQPVPYTVERAQETEQANRGQVATPMALSGAIYLAWPFTTPKSEWYGWSGDKTGGGSIPNYCRKSTLEPATINSHSYGDNYSRDLSRYDGGQEYDEVHAASGGSVIFAGIDGCYGYTVIIWDESRGIEVRYSHLWSTNPFIGPNMSVGPGALLGWVGGTGCNGTRNFTPHLHMTVYRNLPYHKIGNICTGYAGTYYACPFYFN